MFFTIIQPQFVATFFSFSSYASPFWESCYYTYLFYLYCSSNVLVSTHSNFLHSYISSYPSEVLPIIVVLAFVIIIVCAFVFLLWRSFSWFFLCNSIFLVCSTFSITNFFYYILITRRSGREGENRDRCTISHSRLFSYFSFFSSPFFHHTSFPFRFYFTWQLFMFFSCLIIILVAQRSPFLTLIFALCCF